MKPTKLIAALAGAGLFASICTSAHAGTVAAIKSGDYSQLTSLIPLAIFVVAAVFVYLCNRPRKVVVYARARRRTELPRGTTR